MSQDELQKEILEFEELETQATQNIRIQRMIFRC